MNIRRRRFNQLLLGSTILGSSRLLTGCSAWQREPLATNRLSSNGSMRDFIFKLPKAESHVHLPGCVTPEQLLLLAERNKINLPYDSPSDVEQFIKNSYGPDLSDFITVLDQIASVLRTGEDYYDATYDYLARSARQNVRYVEPYFGPQFAIDNKLHVSEQLDGMNRALRDARSEFGIDGKWIMSFRRDRPVHEAMEILEQMESHRDNIVGVALSELDTPNYMHRFKPVFDRAEQLGYKRTTHVDVGEMDAQNRVWSAVTELKVNGRIDHGIDGLKDKRFVEYLRESNTTLAVCPTLFFGNTPSSSPYFQEVCDAVKFMLDNNLGVTINTDDPGIFSLNYLADIFLLTQEYLDLSRAEVVQLARNSFKILWIDQKSKEDYLALFTSPDVI